MEDDSEQQLSDLIYAIYHAVDEPIEWPFVLERIRLALRGTSASLRYLSKASREAFVVKSRPIKRSLSASRQADESMNAAGSDSVRALLSVSGLIGDAPKLFPDALSDPRLSERFIVIDLSSRAHHTFRAFVVVENANGPFEEVDHRTAVRLTPHLNQACELCLSRMMVEQRRVAAWEILDRLWLGVVLADADGRVLFMNGTAAQIAAKGDGLRVTRGVLEAAIADDSRKLAAALKRATESRPVALHSSRAGVPFTHTLTVGRPSGDPAFHVAVHQAGSRDHGRGSQFKPSVVVFISDPDGRQAPEPSSLIGEFDLTPTEAVIAAHVANGLLLSDVAVLLTVKTSTVRWHMKQILKKVQVSTQSQLVSQLAGRPGFLR